MLTVRKSGFLIMKYADLTILGFLTISLCRHFSPSKRKYTPTQNADVSQDHCNTAYKLELQCSGWM